MFGDGVGKLGWAAATADCVMGITDGEAGRAEQIYSEDGRSAASRAVSQAGSQGTPGRNTRTHHTAELGNIILSIRMCNAKYFFILARKDNSYLLCSIIAGIWPQTKGIYFFSGI